MQGSIITNLLLPAALGVIMLGLGLSLSVTGKYDAAPAPFAAPAGVTLDAANPPENAKLDTLTKVSLIITLL